MATLREKREERQRRLRELSRRAKYARAGQAAQGVLDQPPRTALAEPVIPTIPQGQQAAFTAQQTAQRPARLPLGVQQADIYAPTAAREVRGKPEFGSFLGSGVLETGAGIGLGILENVQKFIETAGGAAVGLAGAASRSPLSIASSPRWTKDSSATLEKHPATTIEKLSKAGKILFWRFILE